MPDHLGGLSSEMIRELLTQGIADAQTTGVATPANGRLNGRDRGEIEQSARCWGCPNRVHQHVAPTN
jgi:hypothetical protein